MQNALERVAFSPIQDSLIARFVTPSFYQIQGDGMGKPHPIEIRSRVIGFIEEGHGHREAARHFRVSPRFVNDMVILKRESGGLAPKARGGRRTRKLAPYDDWMRTRLVEKGDLTLDEIVAEMASVHGPVQHPRRDQSVVAEARDEGLGIPVAEGGMVDEPLTDQRPASGLDEVGLE